MSTAAPRILVTGGTGFAGSHLIETLLAAGSPAETLFTTNFLPKPSFVNTLLPQENILQADLTDADATARLFSDVQPTQVYHLASFSSTSLSLEQATRALETNLKIQLAVLEALRTQTPQARFLAVGSASEYALSTEPIAETHPLGPRDPYGVSKVTQDMLAYSYAARYDLDIVRVRPFNHIGERQEPGFVVSDFARQIIAIERGQQSEMTVGNLDVTRDFTDVKDVALAYLTLMEKGQTNEVYNIGSGQDISIRELLKRMISLATVPITVKEDTGKQRAADTKRSVADITKITNLGWQPTIPLDQTLARVLEWCRTQ